MRKKGVFYVCERCGLSFKPWEIEQAQERAKKELDAMKSSSDADPDEKAKRLRSYKRWIEGQSEIDD
jgi:hypothetical protein